MVSQPLVSIAIPYYDAVEFFPETLRSVQNQTYPNLEVVIVDDCSPGPTAMELARNIKLPNLKIIRHQENQGLPQARNTAINASRGELILPLDCDDLLDPQYVSLTVKALEDTDLGGIYTLVNVFGNLNLIWSPECSLLHFLCGLTGPSTFLYRREVFESLGGYQSDIYHCDSDFWLRALKDGWQFKRLDNPLFFYRKHERGMSKFNPEQEVVSLARAHPELYIEHIYEILQLQEEKYWKLKTEYAELEKGFANLNSHYSQLQLEAKKLGEDYGAIVGHMPVRKLLQTARALLRFLRGSKRVAEQVND